MSSEVSFTPSQLIRFLRLVLGKRVRPLFGWTAVMGIVYFQTLIPPLLVGQIVNIVTGQRPDADLSSLYLFGCALAATVIVEAFFRIGAKPALADLSFRAAYQAKVLGFEQLMRHSIEWHEGELSGNKVHRITTGGAALERLIDQLHSNVLPLTITFFSVAGSFLFYDLIYALYALIFIAAFWGIQGFFLGRERQMIKAVRIASEDAAGAYAESAGNILTIKTLNLESGISRNISSREELVRSLATAQKRYSFRKYFYLRLFDAVAYAGFVTLTGYAALKGTILPGTFIILITYFRSLDAAVRDAGSFMDSLVENWIAVGRLAPLILESEATRFGNDPFPAAWDELKLSAVVAPYKNGEGGLKELSLTIRRGEHIGIVGVSGSGKSSLAKVLMGVVPIQSGSYQIGTTIFTDIAAHKRSERMSMVLQDSELFNMTLAENISVMREVPASRMDQAVHIAALESVVAKLKNGIKEFIGEKGYRLSGGERQRVGIARAICKNPDILILDEATSSLDGATESLIHSRLIQELGEKTLIIIAHRLATIRNVDRIVVIENGAVAEEGSPEELLERTDSRFAAMWCEHQHAANSD